MLYTAGVEVALRLVPSQLKSSFVNQETLAFTKKVRQGLVEYCQNSKILWRESLREAGFSERTIDTHVKIFTQMTAALICGEIFSQASPIQIAISTAYFCSYFGVFLAHHKISDGSVLASSSGLESLPLKFIIGLTMASFGAAVQRPEAVALLTTILSLPMIIDSIVQTKAHQKMIKALLESDAVPPFIRSTLRAGKIAQRIYKYGNSSSIAMAFTGGVGVVSFKLTQLWRRPSIQEKIQRIQQVGSLASKVFMKYQTVSLFSSFLPPEVAILANLSQEPKNRAAVLSAATGIGVTALTGNTLLATIVMEGVKTNQCKGFCQRSVNTVKSVFTQVVNFLSNLEG
jgi:hypothetical protein